MAKMFYSLEEAAERLGVSADEIKELAVTGKLQQFRDREKLMFKREEVDALSGGAPAGGSVAGRSATSIPLVDSGDTDAIDLQDSGSSASLSDTDPRQATGISVFDADEVDAADPMAQTQVTGGISADSDLSLESVGSGSGLLDLTRESDDTSLGAELLDEIYPGGESSDAKLGTGVGSSGVFDGSLEGSSAALDHAMPTGEIATGPGYASSAPAEAYDPAGSGFGAGMLIGAAAALAIALIIGIGTISGTPSAVTKTVSDPMIWAGGIFGASVLFGIVGLFIGKSRG